MLLNIILVVAILYLGYALYKQAQLKEPAPSTSKDQVQVNVTAAEQTKEAADKAVVPYKKEEGQNSTESPTETQPDKTEH